MNHKNIIVVENITKTMLNRKSFHVKLNRQSLLAFTANSAAQSSAQSHIHSAIVVIDTSNNAWHSQVHWLVQTPYLAVKASNEKSDMLKSKKRT